MRKKYANITNDADAFSEHLEAALGSQMVDLWSQKASKKHDTLLRFRYFNSLGVLMII